MAEKSLSRFKKLQAEARAIWGSSRFEHDREMSRLEKIAHFSALVIKSFWRNRCPVRASALAYTTLLALVPLLAVGISISTSLLKRQGGKQQIEQLINSLIAKIAPQLDLVSKAGSNESGREKVVESINAYINNVSSGTLGATATIALVFVAISLLSTIEATVNDIWGVTQGRSWFSRIVQYWALITLGPVILLFVMGANVGPYLTSTQEMISKWPIIGTAIYQLLPVVLLMLVFSGFYKLMPNTKVTWGAALVGGIIGGGLWQLNNIFSVVYFGQVVRNSQIYGKLAIVPVFLLGIYFSWLIVLFGAQVAYAFQNRRAYIQEQQTENVNERGREFVALRLMTVVARKFYYGELPPTIAQIADALCVPSQLVTKVIQPLLQTQLLLEVNSKSHTGSGYAPGRPLDRISYDDILKSVRAGYGQELETRDDAERKMVREKYEAILSAQKAVAGAMTLKSLVEQEEGK